jgi:hypothetical protein
MEVLENSIIPLYLLMRVKTEIIDNWFSNSLVSLNVNNRSVETKGRPMPELLRAVFTNPQAAVGSMSLLFHWKNFKKAGKQIFDHNESISFQFKPLLWTITVSGAHEMTFMYQERPDDDQMRLVVDSLRTRILAQIEARLISQQA